MFILAGKGFQSDFVEMVENKILRPTVWMQSRIQNPQLYLGYLVSLGHTSASTTNPHQNCNSHREYLF